MSFDKDKGPDPALQAQLRQAQEDHDEKKAQMKQMEENNKMAEALAPALQALALGRKEPQATLKAKMAWEPVTARNFVGILPEPSMTLCSPYPTKRSLSTRNIY